MLTFLIFGILEDESITRPAFEGYEYVKDEYCQTATFDNTATTIEAAIAKCSGDAKCVAVEDRWGTGEKLGLCAKFNGKRSGAQSLLLKKGMRQKIDKVFCKIHFNTSDQFIFFCV